jgi:hypothetical protein
VIHLDHLAPPIHTHRSKAFANFRLQGLNLTLAADIPIRGIAPKPLFKELGCQYRSRTCPIMSAPLYGIVEVGISNIHGEKQLAAVPNSAAGELGNPGVN